jgi:hypothetical protein
VCTSHKPNKDGYIRVFAGVDVTPRVQFLHRLTWKSRVGEIPDGYEINHTCKNRQCCNIDHLELLTKSQHRTKDNVLRYRDRIDKVCDAIRDGKSTLWISKEFNIPREYVYRYRRKLKQND